MTTCICHACDMLMSGTPGWAGWSQILLCCVESIIFIGRKRAEKRCFNSHKKWDSESRAVRPPK